MPLIILHHQIYQLSLSLSLSSSECDGSSGMLCSLSGLHQSALTRLVGSECVLVFYLQQFASTEISKREEGKWERLFKQSDRERERETTVCVCMLSQHFCIFLVKLLDVCGVCVCVCVNMTRLLILYSFLFCSSLLIRHVLTQPAILLLVCN